MAQLCTATIIRDEHIARLSQDLKEVDRFTLLRGAVDADDWIRRARSLAAAASLRVKSATTDVSKLISPSPHQYVKSIKRGRRSQPLLC